MADDQALELTRAEAHIANPAVWILDNEFINENQQPIEFDWHRFMLQPYSDMSPDQATMKSAQIGWSVKEILRSIHAAKMLRFNVIYILPTRNASAEFVVPKVNPMLRRNPGLAELVQNTDNKSLKQVGDRFIYFKGAHHEGEAISTSADLLVSDEYDRCNQAVLMAYQSRLQASKFGWNWRFSNPSVPGFGIHELYQHSDQMHWFVTCAHCRHESYMDFEHDPLHPMKPHYVDQQREIYACGKCGKEIDDEDRQSGRWIARYPNRPRRGYWISQLMVPWVSAAKILKQRDEMPIDVFYNFVLGLPYQASEYLINREAILRSNQQGVPPKVDVAMGCDSGKVKHFVIGTPEGIFTYGKTENWEDVERLIRMYNATCVIDALPDFTVPEQLARKYPGKVFVHYYSHDSKSLNVIERKEGEQFGVLQSDRTKLFDMLAAEITNQTINFFQQPAALEELIYHFEQMYRIVETDTRGIQRARWETKANRPDHFAHAAAYYRVALSQMVLTGEVGGVQPTRPIKKAGYYVHDGNKVRVKDALGMDLDELVDKSLARNKRHKVV